MAFEQVHESIDKLGAEGAVPSEKTSTELAPDAGGDSTPENAPNLIDLDQVEKFKYRGEEWDRTRLEKSMLMQSDYTRKSQQLAETRKQFTEEKRFYDNLAVDIASVLKNPSLVEQFKSIYPEKFHSYLNHYQDLLEKKQEQPGGETKSVADPRLLNRLEQVENRFREQEVAAAEAQLDGIFDKFKGKYPYADEASVTTKAMALMDQLKSHGEKETLSDKQWDALFKSEHERIKTRAESSYKEEVKKQLQSNRTAKDTAPGGGTPGQAPVKRTFKQATEDAIRDAKAGRI